MREKSKTQNFKKTSITKEELASSKTGRFIPSEREKTFDEISKDLSKSNNLIKCKEYGYRKEILQKNISFLVSGILSINDLVLRNKNNELYNKMCLEFLENLDYENLDYANIEAEGLEKIFLNLKKEFAGKQFFLFTIKVKENIKNLIFEDYKYYKY
ncbi:MAG: hypothetical protein PHR68_02665 [Candidatus Gracilibacteria bacterium]|nr:hypothetical protein [Candidatus Gracilibacteria bacterium]